MGTLKTIIEVTNLRKKYGKMTAVKDISFYVEQGRKFKDPGLAYILQIKSELKMA
jgi:ABC-type uncharacterized transport system ATPase subunit